MSLNSKNAETCGLPGELAHLTGEAMTGAITVALRERLERERSERSAEARVERLLAIGRRCAGMMGDGPSAVEHGDFLYDAARAAQVIVDTSAVLAILLHEWDAERYARAMTEGIALPHVRSHSRGNYNRSGESQRT